MSTRSTGIELPDRQLALVLGLVGVIVYVTGTFTGIDWAVFFHDFDSTYSPYARYMRTLLCAMLAFAVGSHILSLKDHVLLWSAFVLTCIADYFLILTTHFIVGVGVFMLVHLTLTVRHAQGFRASLQGPDAERVKRRLLASFLAVFVPGGLLIKMVGPDLEKSGLAGLDVVYMVVLMTSAWMAWGTLIRGFYPRLNAWLIALGMSFFFACDIALGLSHVYASEQPTLSKIFGMVPDLTYSTALTLVALSGYKWTSEPGDWEES
ncbi:MAG: hypothetical protein H6741_15320 [Alphaproteobacteria bacterium]|nr:hypothetical protein [Alphaproteobacteria bacterium]